MIQEFPNWIGCMALKELRIGLRRGQFVVPFAVVHLLAIGAVLMDSFSGLKLSYIDKSVLGQSFVYFPTSINPYNCGSLWSVVGVSCIFVVPYMGLSMMSQELREGNRELLMLTRLKRNRVVLEKFLSLWALSILMLISFLPYAVVPYLVSGMRIGLMAELVVSTSLFSAVMCAFMIGLSCYLNMVHRILYFLLFGSGALSVMGSVNGVAALDRNVIWHYLNTACATVGLITFALATAKSKLKLTSHYYEGSASTLVVIMLFFSPILLPLGALVTWGYMPSIPFLGLALLAWYADTNTPERNRLAAQRVNHGQAAKVLARQ